MLVEQYSELNKEYANPKLERYYGTKTLQRLKGKGLFCGMDYVGMESLRPIEYYSRFEHSKNIANVASTLHDELKVALAGAFHDVGSLSFAHVNSFKKGEALTQDNDELDVKSILLQDEELLTYLHEDGIDIDEVSDCKQYPLIDKPIPTLCLDRSDGILATCLFCTHTHTFEQIKELHYMIRYLDNLNGIPYDYWSERFQDFNGEIVLNENGTETDYEDFFAAIHTYSMHLLSKEDRYMMEVLGLTLKYYEDIGVIRERDLFDLSEQEIISRILDSKYRDVWVDVTTFDKVDYAKDMSDELAIISKPKIRQANPLCFAHFEPCEIHNISGDFYRELNNLEEAIILTDKPITGNLSQKTKKILAQYRK